MVVRRTLLAAIGNANSAVIAKAPLSPACRVGSGIRLGCVFCGLLIALGGCSQNTRLPSLVPNPADSSTRSYTIHDPLPETNIAPDMAARPRGFTDEWAEPRRTLAAQGQLPMFPPPGSAPLSPNGQSLAPANPPAGPSSQMYPDAVPQ